MNKLRLGLAAVLLSSLPACGGVAEDADEGGSSDSQGTAGATGSSGWDKEELGVCEAGFAPDSSHLPCNWIFNDLCYVDRDDACACACPQSGDSVCISGWGGYDAREPISCFEE